MIKLGAEDVEQIKLFDWIKSREDLAPYSFHIANERKCSPHAGKIFKRKGVKAGVSDNFIGVPRGEWHGMFLELKAKSGKPSEKQCEFMEDMASQGYYCIWVVGFEEAKKAILKYLEIPSCECCACRQRA